MNYPPLRGTGHNIQNRRREVARTHQDGGCNHTLQRQADNRTTGALTQPSQVNDHATTPHDDTRTPEDRPQGYETQRLRNEPRQVLNQPRCKRKQIKIATLNMNGRGNNSQDKWGAINNTIKRRQIAMLGLQETHPNNEMQATVGRRFRNALHILHSADPQDPSRTAGVSFAIHKGIIDIKNITYHEVIQGRTILLEIPWGENDKLKIMNIYAPAGNTEKTNFWRLLMEKIESNEDMHPDVMMGDFNLVENPELDRLNNRRGTDPMATRDILTNLKIELDLVDGWCRRHPKKRGYTFTGESQSRLDRIYMKEDTYPWCTEWKIEHPGFKTDHSLVSIQITSENMPFIGRGRWAIPVGLLKNRKLKKDIQELARQL